jgi:hypothetical protein
MTSQINPNNVDGTYPVAGQPNNTQGFRDNFTNIKTNFSYAGTEITDLQNNGIFKAALSGTTLDNNMADNLIYAVKLQDVSYTYVQNTASAGSINIDYSAGPYQYISTTGSISLNFENWPVSGTAGVIQIAVNVTSTAHTLTLPAAVTLGTTGIQGYSGGVITFAATGTYQFEFSTSDGGTTITIYDLNRPLNYFTNTVNIAATTPSTSKTTGALTVAGGAGIGANLNVGGNFSTYTTANAVAFQALDTGLVSIYAPTVAANTGGALNIVGSTGGAYQPIYNAGSMLHITGNDGQSARVTVDTFGTSQQSAFVQRAARGTAAAPTAVQANDILARITGSGYGNTGYVLAAGNIGTLGIDFVALENYTTANAGSSLKFYTSPIGAVTKTLSANVTANVTTFPAVVSVTGNVLTNAGNVLVNGGTGGLGYTAGAGGTVAQSGNKSGGVTLNKQSGEITMQNTNLAADTIVSFVLTNSTIGANDLLVLQHQSGGTLGAYTLNAACAAGSATIYVRNNTAGGLAEALVLRYAVIKGAVA